jgi:hypothetical protein
VGKGAIDSLPPPIIVGGWEGDDRVGKNGQAKLGGSLATPEVMGKVTINPWQLYFYLPLSAAANDQPTEYIPPPMLANGTKWQGECNGIDPPKNMVRMPSTLGSNRASLLVDIPPPCLQMAQGGKRSVP